MLRNITVPAGQDVWKWPGELAVGPKVLANVSFSAGALRKGPTFSGVFCDCPRRMPMWIARQLRVILAGSNQPWSFNRARKSDRTSERRPYPQFFPGNSSSRDNGFWSQRAEPSRRYLAVQSIESEDFCSRSLPSFTRRCYIPSRFRALPALSVE